MTWAETYGQGPGQIENYLSWIGADRSGTRGEALTSDRVATIQITGEADVLRNLARIITESHDRAVKRLGQNCEFILNESKEEVPVDMTYKPGEGGFQGGTLKQSGTVQSVMGEDAFEIGYNTPYAARQHEDMTLHHTRPGAKAKYLEDPAMRIAPTIAADIAEYLKGVLG